MKKMTTHVIVAALAVVLAATVPVSAQGERDTASVPASVPLPVWSGGALALGQAADTASTCYAIRQPNLKEGNGMLPHTCGAIATIKLITVAGVWAITKWANKHDHSPSSRKALIAVRVIMGAAGAGAAAWNTHQVNKVTGRR